MATDARSERGARGEEFIEVGGERLSVLLTNRALAEVEKATEKTIVQILQEARAGAPGMNETAQLLRAGLEYGRRDARNGGRQVTLDDAWRAIDAIGFVAAARAVLLAVAGVLEFGGEDSNHEKHETHEQDPNG